MKEENLLANDLFVLADNVADAERLALQNPGAVVASELYEWIEEEGRAVEQIWGIICPDLEMAARLNE